MNLIHKVLCKDNKKDYAALTCDYTDQTGDTLSSWVAAQSNKQSLNQLSLALDKQYMATFGINHHQL